MGISLTPLVWTLLISAFACWLTNVMMVRENLIEDIAFKSFVYIVAGIFILVPICRKSEVRQIFREMAMGFGLKV